MKKISALALIIFTILVLFGFFFSSTIFAWFYPGQEDNPTCLPSDPTCDVYPAVSTDQTTPQTIGDTTNRLLKLWATDITATNAITGSLTGNAGTVTNGVYTTGADSVYLTPGTAASTYLTSYTETDPVFIASEAYNITSGDITNLSNLSGTNTGDNAVNSLYSGLATSKQDALSGTGFVKITGTTISYDNSTYLTSLSGALLADGSVVGATSQSQLFTNGVVSPTIIGGITTTSPLTFQSTTGVGTTGADIIFKVGNNGGTEAMRILNSGNVGIGTTAPGALLDLGTAGTTLGVLRLAGSALASGNVTIQPIATTGTWTLTLPTDGGLSDQVLRTDGSGNLSWVYTTTGADIALDNLAAVTAVNSTLNLRTGSATALTAPLKFTSGTLLTTPELGALEFNTDDLYISTAAAGAYTSQYPPAYSTTYIKSTTAVWLAFNATDPSTSLIGASGASNSWLSANAPNDTNQRFHIDLGSGKVITRIYYENYHNNGGNTNSGVQNFILQGSNDSADFANTTYVNDGNWVQLATSQSTFDEHIALNQADPKYITVTNSTAYRYYAFKFADDYGGTQMGVRRIGLQTGGTLRKGIVLTDGNNLTSGRIPYATINGRLVDSGNLAYDGTNLVVTGQTQSSKILGGQGVDSSLSLQTTTANSGAGTGLAVIKFLVGTNGATEAGRITWNGLWGLGTIAPAQKLDVVGAVGDTTVVRIATTSGNACTFSTVTGAWTCASDARLKHDINSISGAESLSSLMALNPVMYHFNWQNPEDPLVPGFIAQEFETIFPNMVVTDPETGYKSLSYTPLIPYTIKALQELDLKINDLTNLEAPLLDENEEKTFVGRFFDRLIAWFGDVGNGIEKLFVKVISSEESYSRKAYMDELYTKKLCMTDESETETCITKEQFDQIISNTGINPIYNSSPEPEIIPDPESQPEVDSSPEEDLDSIIEPIPDPEVILEPDFDPEIIPESEPREEEIIEPQAEANPPLVEEIIPEPTPEPEIIPEPDLLPVEEPAP